MLVISQTDCSVVEGRDKRRQNRRLLKRRVTLKNFHTGHVLVDGLPREEQLIGNTWSPSDVTRSHTINPQTIGPSAFTGRAL